MRRQIWTALATLLVGLSLLTLAQSTPAGTIPGCCICPGCPSGGAAATCQDIDLIGGPGNCPDFCTANNCDNTTAQTTMSGTCLDVAACQAAAGPAAAPTLGAAGMAGAGLLLAAVGLLQILRLRRQA
jgi:hypothetical protein